MFLRVIINFIKKEKKAISVIFFSTVAGTAVIATMLSLSLEIEDKVKRELRSFGANIIVEPEVRGLMSLAGQPHYLTESDIPKIKTIFWRHNIIGIAPFLESSVDVSINGKISKLNVIGTWFERELPVPGESGTWKTGIFTVAPWWYIEGRVPAKGECLIGSALAQRLKLTAGESITIGKERFTISGIISTGSKEDESLIMNLEELQSIKGLQGKISSIWISALTTPMDEFAYKDPSTMTPAEYEKWYCTGYVTSIAKQIAEVVRGSSARPVWRVAEAEGNILKRLKLAVYLMSLITLLASAMGLSATLMSSFLKRSREIGLMKAMGGSRLKISMLLLSGVSVVSILASLGGFILSLFLSNIIGKEVFGTGLENRVFLLPMALVSGILMNLAGAFIPLKRTLALKPAIVLKGME
ncbi:MAG: ABC transporter permease [Thermodesulfovibrionales bacterium]|nr:ABC transporter permease [Thermodesulfovibrionales bacterium]